MQQNQNTEDTLKDMAFCHLQENLVINMVKKINGYCNKNRNRRWIKTAFKQVIQKTAEATRDLIGNKIADKITLFGKTKSKENERQEIYIPLVKRQQIIDDLRLF